MKQRFPVRALALFLALFALSAAPAGAQLAAVPSPSGPVVAGPYLVVDAATGETLLQRDPGAAWYPASLTKLMTLYLVFEDLKAGRLTLATPVPFSQHAASASPSKLGIGVGGSITVEQAIQSLVARSANDAAVALGEKVSGSEAAFAQRMTQTAKRLGMTATEFRNANGWPDPGQVTTARDLAILTLALMRDVGEYYPYFQTREFMLGKQLIGPGVKFVEMYSPYADGLKTGFICSSGFNIVGSAVRDGRRLIAIAFGFRRADLRDEFLVRLFDQAFALKTAGSRPKIWQVPQRGRPSDHGAEPGRVRPDPLRHAGRCGVARHLRRLAHRPQCLRRRPGRARLPRCPARQGVHPARHGQQGDPPGRDHRRPRARCGPEALRPVQGEEAVLRGEETAGLRGAFRGFLALARSDALAGDSAFS